MNNPTLPKMTEVKSSNIHSVGHDPANNSLHVLFKNGSHYVYEGVPAELHQFLQDVHNRGESVGSFINTRIKGRYDYRRLS